MEQSSSFNQQPQDSSGFHVGETSSTNLELGHAQAANLSPGDASGDSARIDVEPISLPPEACNCLYLAALRGDWHEAKSLINKHSKTIISVPMTGRKETALHIAAAAQQTKFVEKLVKKMEPDELTLQTETGYRALCFAAISGAVRIAKVLVQRNPGLPYLRGYNDSFPLYLAVIYKRKDMADYLLSETDLMNSKIEDGDRVDLLHATILSDYYDIGLRILEEDKNLAVKRNVDGETALHALARRPHAIGCTSQLGIWKKCINFCLKGFYSEELMRTFAHQMVKLLWKTLLEISPKREDILGLINSPSRLLDDAAKVGNAEFLTVLISLSPDLIIWNFDGCESIFHIAVENRQESVFKLIYEIGGVKDIIARFTDLGNKNMLYLAAILAASEHINRVSGPLFQMQREVQWFKEVEKIVALPSSAVIKNTSQRQLDAPQTQSENTLDGLTKLWEIFTEEHKELQEKGKEWMKRTSNSCMLVATLIATVVFAAAFSVPGGNNDQTGIPIFRHRDAFPVFVLTDTLALISSSVSILMFLSILTSRFAQEDFLKSLPRKLFFGLATLLVSIACMDAAFGTAFFLVYDTLRAWTPWFVSVVVLFPVLSFSLLEHNLLAETYRATFYSVFKPRQRNLF